MKDVYEDVQHKRAVQGALSIGTATLGIAALGSKAGAVALKKYPKALKGIKHVPKSVTKIKPKTLNNASLTLTTGGAGLGGMSGYHFAALQRSENKAQKERQVSKMLKLSPFGVVSKADYDSAAQYAGYGGAAAGVGGAFAAKDIAPHYAKYRLKKISAEEKAQVKAQKKAEAKSIKYEQKQNSFRAGRDNSLGRGSGAGLDGNAAGAKKYSNKVVREAGKYYRAGENIKRLADKKVMVKTTAVPKVRAAALGVGAASLAASEVARQHKVQKDGWWGA
jgi:hypothetical protein